MGARLRTTHSATWGFNHVPMLDLSSSISSLGPNLPYKVKSAARKCWKTMHQSRDSILDDLIIVLIAKGFSSNYSQVAHMRSLLLLGAFRGKLSV